MENICWVLISALTKLRLFQSAASITTFSSNPPYERHRKPCLCAVLLFNSSLSRDSMQFNSKSDSKSTQWVWPGERAAKDRLPSSLPPGEPRYVRASIVARSRPVSRLLSASVEQWLPGHVNAGLLCTLQRNLFLSDSTLCLLRSWYCLWRKITKTIKLIYIQELEIIWKQVLLAFFS